MTFKQISIIIGMAMLSLPLASCGDDDLFRGEFGIEGEGPELTIPLAYGTISIWEVLGLEDEEYLELSGDTIVMVYNDDSILEDQYVSEFFEMDIQTVGFSDHSVSIPHSEGEPLADDVVIESVWQSTKISFPEEADVDEMLFNSYLKTSIPALSFKYEVTLDFLNLYKDGELLSVTYDMSNNVNNPVEESIYEELIWKQITKDSATRDRIDVDVTITIPAGEVIDSDVSITVSVDELTYEYAIGSFGHGESVPIDETEFSIDGISLFDEITGDYKYVNPTMTLTIYNYGIGVPFEIEMDYIGENRDGEVEDLHLYEGETLMVTPNGALERCAESRLSYNNQNSNIVDFFALPPTQSIYFSGDVRAEAEEGRIDTIWSDSHFSLGVEIRIPLELEAEGMIFKDTLSGLDFRDLDKLKYGEMKFNVQNEIPFNMELTALNLLDKEGNYIGTLHSEEGMDRILAGTEESPVESTIYVSLDYEEMVMMSQADRIEMELTLASESVAALTSTQTLSFSMTVIASAELQNFIE